MTPTGLKKAELIKRLKEQVASTVSNTNVPSHNDVDHTPLIQAEVADVHHAETSARVFTPVPEMALPSLTPPAEVKNDTPAEPAKTPQPKRKRDQSLSNFALMYFISLLRAGEESLKEAQTVTPTHRRSSCVFGLSSEFESFIPCTSSVRSAPTPGEMQVVRVAFTGVVDTEVQFVELFVMLLRFNSCRNIVRELGGSVVDTVDECSHLYLDDKARNVVVGLIICAQYMCLRSSEQPSSSRPSGLLAKLLAESGPSSVRSRGNSSVRLLSSGHMSPILYLQTQKDTFHAIRKRRASSDFP